jgi:hypothetical protein
MEMVDDLIQELEALLEKLQRYKNDHGEEPE